jgi:very-short-patch-repair endonuclease
MAARQHGVVSIHQLREAGLSDDAVLARVRAGRLHRLHRGVYAVGHPGVSRLGRWMAATLACGEGAVVSHRSAAALWGLLTPRNGPIDISLRRAGGRRRRQGLRLHRCQSLLAGCVTRRLGIPVTTPARTVSDLPGVVSDKELRRAVRQAEVLGLPIGLDVARDRTRSDLERDFLGLCRHHRLPAPEVNVRIGPHLVDFIWWERRLVIETDGYRYHRGRQAFEDDRARDLDLRAKGFEVLRLSEKQVDEEPGRVAEVLRAALASARHRVEPDG